MGQIINRVKSSLMLQITFGQEAKSKSIDVGKELFLILEFKIYKNEISLVIS